MTTSTRIPARPPRPIHCGRIAVWAVMLALAIAYLLPVYVMVANGLKDAANVSLSRMWAPPLQLTAANGFIGAWQRLSPNMTNSLLMVIPATILSSLIGAINGYLFAKWKFRGSDILFTLLLFGFFIPYQSILLPLVRFLQVVGLYGKLPGLVLVHVIYGIPITTLIFRNYYAEVPNEMVEASRIDGAGFFGIYRHILFPLSLPGFVVVIIWQFTNIWNEFLFAVTTLQRPELQPITVALRNLSGSQIQEWNMVMAGTIIAAVPTLIVYIVMGRYFIRGLLAGSVKG